MIPYALSFMSGIALYRFIPFFPFSLSILLLFICVLLFARYRERSRYVFLLILLCLFGFLSSFYSEGNIPGSTLPGKEVYMTGEVADVPELLGERWRFTVDSVGITGSPVPGKIRLYADNRFSGRNGTDEPPVSPGDRIGVHVILKEPLFLRNPGVYSFDYRQQGIIASGYIQEFRLIGEHRNVAAVIHRKRQHLGRVIDRSLSEESAALIKAIIPGLKAGVRTEMRDAFSETGLAHLLSISGTHFGLLAFLIFTIIRTVARWLPKTILSRMTLYYSPTQIAVVLTLPVLAVYAMISGFNTPTVRSLIMVSIYMTALYLGRKDQWLNSLSIAALMILLWRPMALFELSFMLSFLAVLSIGFTVERRKELIKQKKAELQAFRISPDKESSDRKIMDRITAAISITVAAVVGTAPVVAVVFKQLPLISPVSNLVVTPLVCFMVLPLGFLSTFTAVLLNLPFLPFSSLLDVLTHSLLQLIQILSRFPYSHLHIHTPSVLMITLFFTALAVIVKFKSAVKYVPLAIVLFVYAVSPYWNSKDMKVTVLDVGQGESSVVELPDNKVMVIDGGSDRMGMGRRVVAPFLWSKGVHEIDYLLSSHGHADHVGGLMYLLDEFKIGEVWTNGRSTHDATGFLKKLDDENIPHRRLSRGYVLDAEDYALYVLHPYDEFYAGSPRGAFSDENSSSLVIKVEAGSSSILFTGDIEEEAEHNIVHLHTWLQSDILKVPHHGGKTSSTIEFLNAVSPSVALVSAGRGNSFGHPHYATRKRYEDIGVEMFRTDRDGAVTVTMHDGQYEIKTYSDVTLKRVTSLKDEFRNLKLLI